MGKGKCDITCITKLDVLQKQFKLKSVKLEEKGMNVTL